VDEEWRVSLVAWVQMAGAKPASASAVRDALLGRVPAGVSVTAGKAGVFLYAATAGEAAAAEGAARQVLAELGMIAEVRVEGWDPARRAWLPAGEATAGPPPGQEPNPGRRRLRAVGTVIAAIVEGMGDAGA
jgi:hypothetical protein